MKAIEKQLLTEGLSDIISVDDNITLSLAVTIVGIVMFVLFLFVPKIYFSNNIYKSSVEIQNLKNEYLSLKDENNILKNRIALLKYKNGVTH